MSSDAVRQVAGDSVPLHTPQPQPQADQRPRVLTAIEVAGMLRVHVETVKRWATAGTLKGMKIGGRWRFNIIDVEDFQRRCQWRPMHEVTAEHTEAAAEYMANPSGRTYDAAMRDVGDGVNGGEPRKIPREGRHQGPRARAS